MASPDDAQVDKVREIVGSLGEPFARALGVFVGECLKIESAKSQLKGWMPLDRLDPELRRRVQNAVQRDRDLERSGKLPKLELGPDTPVLLAASRLRDVLEERGLTQRQLAAMLKVTPAVISRVLKNPDRSKVVTLRKIAQALGVDLHQII